MNLRERKKFYILNIMKDKTQSLLRNEFFCYELLAFLNHLIKGSENFLKVYIAITYVKLKLR